jgi:hypothetical protein
VELAHEAITVSDADVQNQQKDIGRLIDLTFHFCADAATDTPALWTCRRLGELGNIAENFPFILDCLFRLAREFPRCTAYVVQFIINNQSLCRGRPIKNRVVRWTRTMLHFHLPHGNDFETAWSLVLCGVLKLKVRKVDLPTNGLVPSPVILALLGLLRQHGLLKVPLSKWGWRKQLQRSGVHGEYWLPFYEAVLRRWTSDRRIVGAVNNDPILRLMLRAKITFLQDEILTATKVDISRRVFSKVHPTTRTVRRRRVRGFGDIVISPSDLEYE